MDAFVRSRKTRDVPAVPAKAKAPASAATPSPSPAAADTQKQKQHEEATATAAPGPAPMWLEDDSLPDHERALRRFDHDRRFGPAIGMTRSERWQRAAALGLEPPPEVLELLQKHGGGSEACLWEGRV